MIKAVWQSEDGTIHETLGLAEQHEATYAIAVALGRELYANTSLGTMDSQDVAKYITKHYNITKKD